MNNSSINKFGSRRRDKSSIQVIRGKPGLGFKLTSDNQYDMEARSLRNISEPKFSGDAATKQYADILNFNMEVRVFEMEKSMEQAVTKQYVDLMNYNTENRVFELEKLYSVVKNKEIKGTSDGQYDMQDKALTNISDPRNSKDAATKQYTDRKIDELEGKFNFTINSELGKLHKAFNEKVDKEVTELRAAYTSTQLNKQLKDFVKKKFLQELDGRVGGILKSKNGRERDFE